MNEETMNFTWVRRIPFESNVFLCAIDGKTMSVPLDPNNRHYAEILRQVEAGELTIQEASD